MPGIDTELTNHFRHGMLMTLTFTVIAATVFRAHRFDPRLRFILLAATTIVDLGTRVSSTMPRIAAEYYTPPPAARALAANIQPVRIYNYASLLRRTSAAKVLPYGVHPWIVRNGLMPSSEMTWGFEGMFDLDVTSTNLLPMVHFDDLFTAALTHRLAPRLPMLLQMGGVTHIGFEKNYDPAVIADPLRFDAIEPVVFIPTHNEGRFYFAERLFHTAADAEVRQALFSNQRLSPRTAFTDVEFSPAPARVIASRVSPNRVDVDVEASGKSFLALAVTRHKYWRATIDGTPATLHPANVAFQGVVIERGRHHVAMLYWNPVIVICGIVSLLTAAAMLLIAVAGALRSRGSPSPSPH